MLEFRHPCMTVHECDTHTSTYTFESEDCRIPMHQLPNFTLNCCTCLRFKNMQHIPSPRVQVCSRTGAAVSKPLRSFSRQKSLAGIPAGRFGCLRSGEKLPHTKRLFLRSASLNKVRTSRLSSEFCQYHSTSARASWPQSFFNLCT